MSKYQSNVIEIKAQAQCNGSRVNDAKFHAELKWWHEVANDEDGKENFLLKIVIGNDLNRPNVNLIWHANWHINWWFDASTV